MCKRFRVASADGLRLPRQKSTLGLKHQVSRRSSSLDCFNYLSPIHHHQKSNIMIAQESDICALPLNSLDFVTHCNPHPWLENIPLMLPSSDFPPLIFIEVTRTIMPYPLDSNPATPAPAYKCNNRSNSPILHFLTLITCAPAHLLAVAVVLEVAVVVFARAWLGFSSPSSSYLRSLESASAYYIPTSLSNASPCFLRCSTSPSRSIASPVMTPYHVR